MLFVILRNINARAYNMSLRISWVRSMFPIDSYFLNYVIQGQGGATRWYNCQYYVANSRVEMKQSRYRLTTPSINDYMGYFCGNVVYRECLYIRTTKLSSPEDGHFC